VEANDPAGGRLDQSSELALDVGRPHPSRRIPTMTPIPLCEPILAVNEATYLAESISSGYVSSVDAVRYTGATPLLVDSECSTWNMDTERLQEHVTGLGSDGKPLHPVARNYCVRNGLRSRCHHGWPSRPCPRTSTG
jgi:hypothetical protein